MLSHSSGANMRTIAPLLRRQLSSISAESGIVSSPSSPASTKYNPYRPEPIPLGPSKAPRRPVVKNLKFGRTSEAPAAVAGAVNGGELASGVPIASPAWSHASSTSLAGAAAPAASSFASSSSSSSSPTIPSVPPPPPGSSSFSTSSYGPDSGSGGNGSTWRRLALTSSGNSSNASYRRASSFRGGGGGGSGGRGQKGGPSLLYALGAGVVLLGLGGGYARLTGMGDAAAASAGATTAVSSSKNDPKEAQKARELARSNEPYNSAQLKAFIETLPTFTEDDPSQPMATRMQVWIKSLQSRICSAIEQVEAAPCHSTSLGKLVAVPKERAAGTFLRDSWLRPEGGEGISCVLQEGRIFEKAGVNVSVVHGTLPPPAVKAMTADHEGKFKGWYDGKTPLPFKACGLSCVMHPHNPAAPTVHFNYRYFEVEDPKKPGVPKAWWFGGGSDLTPSYLFPVDAEHFHTSVAEECDSPEQYKRFKTWCDEYFRIKHRGESRGLGGIFFDDLSAAPGDIEGREKLFDFVKRSGEGFVKSYVPIVARRTHADFTERMRQWQQLRRGRYVEFNLVYDRGTQFGLRTPGARIESILMSLPLTARWEYFAKLGTEAGSEESKLLEVLRNPRDWAESGQA